MPPTNYGTNAEINMQPKTTSSTLALIIGGCTGIGQSIALRLAGDGFNVIATSHIVAAKTSHGTIKSAAEETVIH